MKDIVNTRYKYENPKSVAESESSYLEPDDTQIKK